MNYLSKAGFAFVLVLLVVCTHAQEPTKASKTKVKDEEVTTVSMKNPSSANMQGAYAMLMQIVNDGNRDSMQNIQQFKIYTDKYFMYAHALPGDSLAEFGFGTYHIDNGQLTENRTYTATNGAHEDTFTIDITKLGNGYVQVINLQPDSAGRKYVLTEEYGNVSTPVTSPLDGAWKQTKSEFIPKTGAATTNNNPTQFKVYQSGHFMWASTSQDSSTHKPVSTFGYGTFDMAGKNEMKERTTNSTFRSALINKPVTVQLKFTGNDMYQQTINWPTGRSIETYQRMK